ncbi:MAG: PRC-barrel domain-containing protein [Chitinophagaceae bacterium]|nr:PRC-barrel domain-containing protein [Chitinophagaceae bacterium]
MSREKVVVNETLQELRASGYEMAKDEPDIRGWKVINSLNQEIGKIQEVLFDIKSRKIRYLIVYINGKPINLLSRDVIIPVGLAELDEKQNLVFLPDVTVGHLASLPEYKKGEITYQTERLIRDVFIPSGSAASEKLSNIESQENPEREAFYNNDYFDESRMYNRRKSENEKRERVYENEDTHKDDSGRYVRSKSDVSDIDNDRRAKDDVVYIPDDKDPSVLRRARVVRDDDRNTQA